MGSWYKADGTPVEVNICICKAVSLIWIRLHLVLQLSRHGLKVMNSIPLLGFYGCFANLHSFFSVVSSVLIWQDIYEGDRTLTKPFHLITKVLFFCSILVSWSKFPFLFVDENSPLVARYALPTAVPTPAQKIWLHPILGVGGGILKAPPNSKGQAFWCWCWWAGMDWKQLNALQTRKC